MVWGYDSSSLTKSISVSVPLIFLARENQGRQVADVFIVFGMNEKIADRDRQLLCNRRDVFISMVLVHCYPQAFFVLCYGYYKKERLQCSFVCSVSLNIAIKIKEASFLLTNYVFFSVSILIRFFWSRSIQGLVILMPIKLLFPSSLWLLWLICNFLMPYYFRLQLFLCWFYRSCAYPEYQ
jgi:hypothetical protein